MTTTNDTRFTSLILGLLFLALGFLAGWCNAEDDSPVMKELPPVRSGSVSTVHSHTDSSSQAIHVHLQPLNLKAKANLHTVSMIDSNNTLHNSMIFISCLDTMLQPSDSTLKADTLEVCHFMPRDSFWVSLRFAPRDTITIIHFTVHDSLTHQSDTITLAADPTIEKKKNWYEEPLEILGALFAGFLLGEFKK